MINSHIENHFPGDQEMGAIHGRVVVFERLTKNVLPVVRLLGLLGFQVRFLQQGKALTDRFEGNAFKALNVEQIDFGLCKHVRPEIADSDPDGVIETALNKFINVEELKVFAELFAGVENAGRKIRICFREEFERQFSSPALISTWIKAATSSDSKVWVILRSEGLGKILLQEMNPEVSILGMPQLFNLFWNIISKISCRVLMILSFRISGDQIRDDHLNKMHPKTSVKQNAKVLFFPHHGVAYGNLFMKDHFFSDDVKSPLYPDNMVTIELVSANTHNTSDIDNSEMKSMVVLPPQSLRSQIINVLDYAGYCLENYRQLISGPLLRRPSTLIMIILIYSRFKHFKKCLLAFPNAKISISGYEILFPKTLAMALESSGITTVATQDRFITTFYGTCSFIMDTYLCTSEYAAEQYTKTAQVYARKFIPVGSVRTDLLHCQKKNTLLTSIKSLINGRKLVVALNAHSEPDKTISRINPGINLEANRVFIADILSLALKFPDNYFLIRGKNDHWCKLPFFSDLMKQINQTGNISVDNNYTEFNVSYHLCAHADLVIARYSSLGDECLAVGIPVLFHDYLHNSVNLISPCFDYLGSSIMIHSYEELVQETKKILKKTNSQENKNWNPVHTDFLGLLNDGNVKKRILAELNHIIHNSKSDRAPF